MASNGSGANATMRFIAKQNGFSLDSHRSQKLTKKLVARSGLILVMSDNQQQFFKKEYPESEGRVFRIMEYGVDESTDYISASGNKADSLNMPDPTGRDAENFSEFINLANNEADRILHELAHHQII